MPVPATSVPYLPSGDGSLSHQLDDCTTPSNAAQAKSITANHTPSIRLAVKVAQRRSDRKRNSLTIVAPERLPSVTIRPMKHELFVPVIPCNADPATIDIPIVGKVLSTWCLVVLWLGIMFTTCVIGEFNMAPMSENPMIGPSAKVLITAGAMTPDKLDEGQYWRMLWATQMHAGWIHLILNIVNYLPLGYILEPDWGTAKMMAIFICSAISGSLASVNGPGATAVGASGGIFGMMGALMVYILEYWSTISQPIIMMLSVAFIVGVSIGLSFIPYVDKWAHIGGCIGGILAALMLLRDLPTPFKLHLDHFGAAIRRVLKRSSAMSSTIHTSNETSPTLEEVTTADAIAPQSCIPVNRDQSLSEKIKFYRISQDVYADVPAMANPAVVKCLNKSAKRYVNIRKTERTADPATWVQHEDTYQLNDPFVWYIRVVAAIVMVTLWLYLIQLRFGLGVFFSGGNAKETVTGAGIEATRRLASHDGFLAKRFS